jgi:hypothetical protein
MVVEVHRVKASFPGARKRPDPQQPKKIRTMKPSIHNYSGLRPVATPLIPALRSGHRLFQRPSRKKQIPSIKAPSALIAVGFAALISLTASVQAATVIVYTPQAGTTTNGNGPFTIGGKYQVTATAGIIITHLGTQDTLGTGQGQPGGAGTNGFFSIAPQVGLWTADGTTLLASVTVNSSDTLTDTYRYVALTNPVPLAFGTEFLLGALVGASREWWLENTTLNPYTAGGGISMIDTRSGGSGGSTLTAPTGVPSPTKNWGAANAQFTVVPEPSAALLGGIGCLLLLRRRSR